MLIAHWIMTNALYPLAEMEHNGFLVDVNWVNESRKKIESILKKYEDELVQLCGGKSYDWESPKQIEYLLYQEFKYPKPNIMGFQIGGKDDEDEEIDDETVEEEFFDEPVASAPKIGFFTKLFAGIGIADALSSSHASHPGHCTGDCANCPPHYGYRYGRWYYGHGHVHGCEFGGNKGDGSL